MTFNCSAPGYIQARPYADQTSATSTSYEYDRQTSTPTGVICCRIIAITVSSIVPVKDAYLLFVPTLGSKILKHPTPVDGSLGPPRRPLGSPRRPRRLYRRHAHCKALQSDQALDNLDAAGHIKPD